MITLDPKVSTRNPRLCNPSWYSAEEHYENLLELKKKPIIIITISDFAHIHGLYSKISDRVTSVSSSTGEISAT